MRNADPRGSALRNFTGAGKPMIHLSPERRHCFCFLVEEIFNETRSIQRWWIRITLSIFTELGDPVVGLLRIDHRKQIGGIQKRTPTVVQYPKVIGLDSNDGIKLAKR